MAKVTMLSVESQELQAGVVKVEKNESDVIVCT
jgi:hypothetical protein